MASPSRKGSFEEIPYEQRVILTYAMKPPALLSCIVCTVVSILIFRDKKKMSYMYHRLALAMCLVSSVDTFVVFIQSWSVPSSTAGSIHAIGNIATCTLTGFMNQVGTSNQYYYVSLSVYVFFALKYEFRLEKIQWMEKYFHIGVFVIPVGSSIYLAYAEMFNPIGSFCWINAAPEGCDREEYSPCVRGSNKIGLHVMIFAILPTVCNSIIAPIIILACYMNEKLKHQKMVASGRLRGKMIIYERARREKSKLIVKQGGIYLFAFYMSYIVPAIAATMQVSTQRHNFYVLLFAHIFYPLNGLFFTMAYLYLRTKDKKVNMKIEKNPVNVETSAEKKTVTAINKNLSLIPPKFEGEILHGDETSRPNARRRHSWCVRQNPNQDFSSSDVRRRPSAMSLFDGTDEEKWKAFGVYIGSDSDSESDSSSV